MSSATVSIPNPHHAGKKKVGDGADRAPIAVSEPIKQISRLRRRLRLTEEPAGSQYGDPEQQDHDGSQVE